MGDNKKVHHIDLMLQEQLLAVISGRNRHVRLFLTQALDGRETESHKLAETKGCQTIASGQVRNGSLTCLCVAMKRQIICYEVNHLYRCVNLLVPLPNPSGVFFVLPQVNKGKARHRRLRELQAPGSVQWMALLSERLYVGYQSGFTRYRCSALSRGARPSLKASELDLSTLSSPQRPRRRFPRQPAPPGGPHPGLHPPAEPGRPLRCGDLQQGAAAVLQCHRRVRGLPGTQVASAGADVARHPQRSL